MADWIQAIAAGFVAIITAVAIVMKAWLSPLTIKLENSTSEINKRIDDMKISVDTKIDDVEKHAEENTSEIERRLSGTAKNVDLNTERSLANDLRIGAAHEQGLMVMKRLDEFDTRATKRQETTYQKLDGLASSVHGTELDVAGIKADLANIGKENGELKTSIEGLRKDVGEIRLQK